MEFRTIDTYKITIAHSFRASCTIHLSHDARYQDRHLLYYAYHDLRKYEGDNTRTVHFHWSHMSIPFAYSDSRYWNSLMKLVTDILIVRFFFDKGEYKALTECNSASLSLCLSLSRFPSDRVVMAVVELLKYWQFYWLWDFHLILHNFDSIRKSM